MGKMTARKAFPVYFRRIRWLYHKIAENQIKGAPYEHYREEIEALFWFADRVIEQARRLAEKQKMPVDALESVLRQSDTLEALKLEMEKS